MLVHQQLLGYYILSNLWLCCPRAAALILRKHQYIRSALILSSPSSRLLSLLTCRSCPSIRIHDIAMSLSYPWISKKSKGKALFLIIISYFLFMDDEVRGGLLVVLVLVQYSHCTRTPCSYGTVLSKVRGRRSSSSIAAVHQTIVVSTSWKPCVLAADDVSTAS